MKFIIKPKVAELPKILARLQHSVQFLKVFSLVLLGIVALLAMLCLGLAFRGPLVVAFDSKALPVETANAVDPKLAVEAALRAYVDSRFNWDQKTVSKSLASASSFVAAKARKAFESDLLETRKFAEEKAVASRVYVSNVQVALEKGVALMQGDRITNIQGIRAASIFRTQVYFEGGDRTKENPWGIYVTKEIQEVRQ